MEFEDPLDFIADREHFDRIEKAVNKMWVGAAFADQFYGLRGHIDFVRQMLVRRQA